MGQATPKIEILEVVVFAVLVVGHGSGSSCQVCGNQGCRRGNTCSTRDRCFRCSRCCSSLK